MSPTVSLLVSAREWIDARSSEVHRSNVTMEINESPIDWNPRSIQWILEAPDRLGQIILWDGGEAEIDLAVIDTGEIRASHRDIGSSAELEDVLTGLLRWVVGSPV